MTSPDWGGPGRLWSLWDMIKKVWLNDSFGAGSVLRQQVTWCRQLGNVPIPPVGERSKTPTGYVIDRDLLAANIRIIFQFCEAFELSHSRIMAFELEGRLQHGGDAGTFNELAGRLEALSSLILDEAFRVTLYQVPQEVSRYAGAEKLFGSSVHDSFEEARIDISEAGNCLAMGRSTAAVFH